MNKTLPPMLDKPEGRVIGSGLTYWAFAFLLFPFMIALFSSDEGQLLFGDKLDFIYHLVNFIAAVAIFLPYLKESFFEVQLNVKTFFKTVAACAAGIVLLKLTLCTLAFLSRNLLWIETAFGCLLTTESDLAHYSLSLMELHPLWATLCFVLLTPVTVSCLLYAGIFAPVCNHRPWLAYLLVTVGFLILQLLKVLSVWSLHQELVIFFTQFAVHLIACLAYQLTDTVWAPIATHSLANLTLSLLYLLHIGGL